MNSVIHGSAEDPAPHPDKKRGKRYRFFSQSVLRRKQDCPAALLCIKRHFRLPSKLLRLVAERATPAASVHLANPVVPAVASPLPAAAAAAAPPALPPPLPPPPAPLPLAPPPIAGRAVEPGLAVRHSLEQMQAPEKAVKNIVVMRTLEDEIRSASTSTVLTLFPDICPDYLKGKSEELAYDHESIVGHILDQVEQGIPYPKRAGLKRKRQPSSSSDNQDEAHQNKTKEEEAALKFNSDDRRQQKKPAEYVQISKTLIQQMFVFVSQKDIASILGTHGNCLFPAILELETTMAETLPEALPFKLKKTKTKKLPEYSPESLDRTILITRSAPKKEALEEYRAAVAICQQRDEKRRQERQRELDEEENFQNAKIEGTVKDCECCYAEFAMNRMIHCDGTLLHWFCRGCSRRMAETQIGLSKYSLACMSTAGCKSGFSRDQQQQFLDEKMRIALERIEQEHILRMAGIENLETCPFCPFAAEYPPVEVNKEFQCQNPTCEEISCRLCRKATHIPKTCAEAERDNGPSARLTIEEAMSAALIRSCNMCRTPFIKEHGCNKMSCSRPGCNNVQCYVCHKSCDYAHFDDMTRGGRKGNCPLFESAEQRHADEVQAAEEAARKEVASRNPDIDVNLLKITLSDRVLADEKRRREADGGRQR